MTFIREIKPEECQFTIAVEEEMSAVDIDDAAVKKEIEDRLARGEQWAWCTVVVRAHWNRFTGEAVLGCCSYENEEDFKRCDYWEDMKAEALARLQSAVENIAQRLEPLVTQESFDAWIVQKVQED